MVRYGIAENSLKQFLDPLRLESISSPPGGDLDVLYENGQLMLDMSSGDLSTLRAMLNSYLGLLCAVEGANELK